MYQAIKEGLAECAFARAWKGNSLEFCLNLPRESMRLLAADIVGGMLRVKPLTKRAALGRWFLVVFRMQHPLERHDGKLVCLYEQYRWDITEGATPHDAIRRSFDFENEIEDELPDMAPRCVFVRVEKNGLSSFLFEEVLEPRPFKAIILAVGILDIYKHTKAILEADIFHAAVIHLNSKCIRHSCKTHFNKFINSALINH